jgi:2-polyprenyl-3-methyl-5-hydroxy-6-metoxy-1,4-benzoquinol methylase
MKNYHIKQDYVSRSSIEFYDDSNNTDNWQDEVYQYAKQLFDKHNFYNVLDIGAGSGYKLNKYFSNNETLGIDLPNTVDFLKSKYPEKKWSSEFKAHTGYDLIISSDVVEHLLDPDELMNIIKLSSPKLIVLSTPDRNLIAEEYQSGPPKNKSHVREWNFEEFKNYISDHFSVIDHFISNHEQKTQVILATTKL